MNMSKTVSSTGVQNMSPFIDPVKLQELANTEFTDWEADQRAWCAAARARMGKSLKPNEPCLLEDALGLSPLPYAR